MRDQKWSSLAIGNGVNANLMAKLRRERADLFWPKCPPCGYEHILKGHDKIAMLTLNKSN